MAPRQTKKQKVEKDDKEKEAPEIVNASEVPVSAPREVEALVAKDTRGIFSRSKVLIKDCGENDVEIDVIWAGICHSDYHNAKGEWPGSAVYPMVPGHEIAGVVASVGKKVKKFKVGDKVGVGCFVDSCRTCEKCKDGDENYCLNGCIFTYNSLLSPEKQAEKRFPTNTTYGGYSQKVVVDQNYVLSIPDSLPFEFTAPILCAGITMYSPLVYYGAKKGGKKFATGIVGLGGLGDMGVKLAMAMGNKVTVISTSERKREYVEKELKAEFIASGTTAESKQKMASENQEKFDLIICTASEIEDVSPYLEMVKTDGTFCLVGVPAKKIGFHAFSIVSQRKKFVGSMIGGIKETQEVLNFCAKHKIWSEVEKIKASEVNRAFQEIGTNSSAKQRFVIDVKNSLISGDSWDVDMEPCKKMAPHTVNVVKIVGAPDTRGKTYNPANDVFE